MTQKEILWHEILDRAALLADVWSRSLCEHSLLNPDLESDSIEHQDENSIKMYKRAYEICEQMWEFYSMAGEIGFNLREPK